MSQQEDMTWIDTVNECHQQYQQNSMYSTSCIEHSCDCTETGYSDHTYIVFCVVCMWYNYVM